MSLARNQKKEKRENLNLCISNGAKNYIFKKKQWFFGENVPGIIPNIKTGVKIKKEVFSGRSSYQKIEVIDTFLFGRILILDGIIQLSQIDEFIYHEMLIHPAMFYHPNPKKVLIIGGGDGGALREVLKHPIEEVYLVDIDKRVIEISQKYLPFVSKSAFRDKRANIFIEDGIEFIKKYKNFFDVIIIDLTDPSGPSLDLFSQNFYRIVYKALTKNGIMITQSGSFFLQLFQIKRIFKAIKKVFSSVKIHRACISCFFDAEFSFILGSKKINLDKTDFKKIEKKYKKLNPAPFLGEKRHRANFNLKYYTPEIHFSSAVLPKYLAEKLK